MKYDMSIHTNTDARAWVKFFRDCNPDCNVPDDMMLGWFSNAMMAMHDHLKGVTIQNGDHAQHLIDTARREALEEAAMIIGAPTSAGPKVRAILDAAQRAIRALKEE